MRGTEHESDVDRIAKSLRLKAECSVRVPNQPGIFRLSMRHTEVGRERVEVDPAKELWRMRVFVGPFGEINRDLAVAAEAICLESPAKAVSHSGGPSWYD